MAVLTEDLKVKLDSNIKNMLSKGATPDDVKFYANDFKNKYLSDTSSIPEVTLDEQGEIKKSPLDSTFNNLKSTIAEIQKEPVTTDVKDYFKVNIFGADIVLPRLKTTSSASITIEEPKAKYKGLLKSNLKEEGLQEQDLNDDSPMGVYHQNRIQNKFSTELSQLQNSSPDEIAEFVQSKKNRLQEIASYEKEAVDFKDYSDIERGAGFIKESQKSQINSEYRNIFSDLDNVAKEISFKNSPVMSTDIDTWMKAPNEEILYQAQQVGNNIENIGDITARATFQARKDLDLQQGGYEKLYKDNLAYLGIQAETYNTQSQIIELNKLAEEKLKEVEELSELLSRNPSDKNLVQEIQSKVAELDPISKEIEKRKQFITKLSQATLDLPEIDKQISIQDKANQQFQKYSASLETDQPDIAQIGIYAIKGLSNRLLKSAAYADVSFQHALGARKEDESVTLSNLKEFEPFSMPSKIREGNIIKYSKDGKLEGINWDVALPFSAQTIAEMYTMGGIGAPLARYGKLGQIAGLYVGATSVFGGDILQQELEKGLSFNDALGVTSLRLGVETGSEMINLTEFIPFNGISKALGKASKADFINYVGNNWQTLFPKMKGLGMDITKVLWNTGKNAGFESFEEVVANLGNFGVDEYVIANIKPDYRRDNDFTVQNNLNTFLTTLLTMSPAALYTGIKENQYNKYAPNLRWQASQMPKLFLDNLESNFKKGNITEEFYNKGKKEVETISGIYNTNKEKLSNFSQEEQVQHLDNLYKYNQVQQELLKDPTSEVLIKDVEKLAKTILDFNVEATKLSDPQERFKKSENTYIQNLKNFSSPQELKQASIEDLNTAKSILQGVIFNPFSEKVKIEAEKQVVKLDEEILNKTNQPESKESVIDEISSISDPTEQLQRINQELELEEEKDSPNPEIVNSLRELRKELRTKENTVTFKDETGEISYPLNTLVTYQGANYFTRKDEEGVPFLENDITKATVYPSSVADFKPYTPKETKKEEKEEIVPTEGEENLDDIFGKRELSIEEKKANIEKRRQEELDNPPIKSAGAFEGGGNFEIRYTPEEINAKYDAELAALEPVEEKIQEVVTSTQEEKEEEQVEEYNKSIERTNFFGTLPLTKFEAKEEVERVQELILANISRIKKENPGSSFLDLGYTVSVVNANEIPLNYKQVKEGTYERDHPSDDYRYAVITDKDGNFILFNDNGNKSDSGDFLALQKLPKDGAIKSIKEQTKDKRLTFEIQSIATNPLEITKDRVVDTLKDAFDLNSYSLVILPNGDVTVFIDNKQLPVFASNTRLKNIPNLPESILQFLDPKNPVEDPNLETFEQRRYVVEQELVMTSLKGVRFRMSKEGEVYVESNKQRLSPEEGLAKLRETQLNISNKIGMSEPFAYYNWNGDTLTPIIYPTYKEFLHNYLKVPVPKTSTIVKENSYINFGVLVEKPETPKEEPKKDPEVNFEQPQKEKKTPPKTKFTKKKGGLGDTGEFLRAKSLGKVKTNLIQEKEAEEWFNTYLAKTGATFEDLRDVVNSDAWASWKNGVIKLFNDATFTNTYHEAFHDFTQFHLTPSQKKALYAEAENSIEGQKAIKILQKRLGVEELNNFQKFFALEEMLAEDFMKYKLSNQTLILNNRVKRNTTFRKILDFLKALFNQPVSLQTVYEKLSNNQIRHFKRNTKNAFFNKLNRNVEGLNTKDSNDLYNHIDYLIGQSFRNHNLSVSELFNNPEYREKAYTSVYNTLIDYFNQANDNITEEENKENVNEAKVDEYIKTIENLNFVLENWESVVKSHQESSKFLKLSKKIFNEEAEAAQEEKSKEDQFDSDDSKSIREKASYKVLFLVASLPKYLKGESIPQTGAFIPSIPNTVDFDNAWNNLAKALDDTLQYPQLWKKLQELAATNKEYEPLLKSLPSPTDELTSGSAQLRNSFINALAIPSVPLKIVSYFKNELGDIIINARDARKSNVEEIKRNISTHLQESPNPFIEGESNEQKVFNLDKFLAEHQYIERASPVKRAKFLEDLGFEFSESTKKSQDYLKLISKEDFILNRLVKTLKDFKELRDGAKLDKYPKEYKAKLTEKEFILKDIYSPIDAIYKTIYGRNSEAPTNLLQGAKETIDVILDIEVNNGEKFTGDSVINPKGDIQWDKKQFSQHSVDYNLLNDVETFPTLQDLGLSELGSYFWVDNNPDADNIYLRALFNLDTESPNYGNRILDKDGKPVRIELNNHAGIEISNETGKKTSEATAFEKDVMDIVPLLTKGIKSHPTYGDKTTNRSSSIIFRRFVKNIAPTDPLIPVDTRDFKDSVLPEEAWLILRNQLSIALFRTNQFYTSKIGENWANYKENIDDWGFIHGMLSKETEEKIIKSGLHTTHLSKDELLAIIDKNKSAIKKEMEAFFQEDIKQFQKRIESNTVLEPKDYITKALLNRYGYNTILASYVVNSWIMNAEHIRLEFQDPRFYNNKKKGYREAFKRFSKAQSDGVMPLADAQINNYLQNLGRAQKEQYDLLHPETPSSPLQESGNINSIILDDVILKPEAYVKMVEKEFENNPPLERIGVADAYSKITSTDAFGFSTLDFYRNIKIRLGSDNWTDQTEKLYQKIVKKTPLSQREKQNALLWFAPLKLRQTGRVWDSRTYQWIPVDYKFAVTPLLPGIIDNSVYDVISNNMIRQNVELGVYSSGSKHSAILPFNQMYSNPERTEVYTGDYTINKTRYEYLYEVVSSPEEFKEEILFSTQQRSLLFLNHFKDGVPLDFKGSKEQWEKLSKEEQIKQSNIARRDDRFASIWKDKYEKEQAKLFKQIDAVYNKETKSYDINEEKFSALLQSEFEKRGLPQNIINSVSTTGGKLTHPLDASIARNTIESVILSIVDNRFRKLKVNGEALIDTPEIGFNPVTNSQKENDLTDFYQKDGRTRKDGSKVTSAKKVSIPLTGDFKKLLQDKDVLKLSREANIIAQATPTYSPEHIALNKLINNEKWLNKGNNRAMVTITDVRIPVQGHPSMEFSEIKHFLPSQVGSLIQQSAGTVAKAGLDNDWDKQTASFPVLTTQFNPDLRQLKKLQALYPDLDFSKNNVEIILDVLKNKQVTYDLTENDQKILSILKEEFGVLSYDSKHPDNELITIIKETLEAPENFKQLITPNDTYMFKSIADQMRAIDEKKQGVTSKNYAQIASVNENTRQHESNQGGKRSLAIAAVYNAVFPKMQKIGMYLNPSYLKDLTFKTRRFTQNRLPHNTVKIDGKTFTSISGIYSQKNEKGEKYKISEAFSQLMNGFVDVAKDDWVFFINGIQELTPTMLFTFMQGVHKDNVISFFNQPVIHDYIKELQNHKSELVKLKNPTIQAKKEAIYNTLKLWIPKNTTATIISNSGKPKTINVLEELQNKYEGEAPFFYGFINNEMRQIASQNKELFEPKEFLYQGIPNEDGKILKPLNSLAQALYLIQYLELEEQNSIYGELARALNQDRKKPESIYESNTRLKSVNDVKEKGLFPSELIDKLANESTVAAFTNYTTGIDKTIEEFTKNLFEVTNHPVFNNFLNDIFKRPTRNQYKSEYANGQVVGQYLDKKGNNIAFEDLYEIKVDIVKTLKNDLISYLYQNYVYTEANTEKVVDQFKRESQYNTALAIELESIKKDFPKLLKNNTLLQRLVRDNSLTKEKGKPKIVSLKVLGQVDNNTSNILTEDFVSLINFSDQSYSPEQILRIQNFGKRLSHFAFVQTGLNKTPVSFAEIIPAEQYANDIGAIITEFNKYLTKFPSEGRQLLEHIYYNPNHGFIANNPKLFIQTFDEQGKPEINFNTNYWRFKDYTDYKAPELLGKQQADKERKEEEIKNLIKSKVSTQEFTKGAPKDNPTTLFLFEDNNAHQAGLGSAVVTIEGNKRTNPSNTHGFRLMPTFKTFYSNSDFELAIKNINEDIQAIFKKIKEGNYTKIVFPSTGLAEISQLKEKAPLIFNTLQDLLQTNFGYSLPNYEDSTWEEPLSPIDKTAVRLYQGFRDKLDDRRFNYFTLSRKEAEYYTGRVGGGNYVDLRPENVREITLDISNEFLEKFTMKSGRPEWTEEYRTLFAEFQKKEGKPFDILNNSPEGLKVQTKFFEFLQSKGYKGYSELLGDYNQLENPYVVTFSSVNDSEKLSKSTQEQLPSQQNTEMEEARQLSGSEQPIIPQTEIQNTKIEGEVGKEYTSDVQLRKDLVEYLNDLSIEHKTDSFKPENFDIYEDETGVHHFLFDKVNKEYWMLSEWQSLTQLSKQEFESNIADDELDTRKIDSNKKDKILNSYEEIRPIEDFNRLKEQIGNSFFNESIGKKILTQEDLIKQKDSILESFDEWFNKQYPEQQNKPEEDNKEKLPPLPPC